MTIERIIMLLVRDIRGMKLAFQIIMRLPNLILLLSSLSSILIAQPLAATTNDYLNQSKAFLEDLKAKIATDRKKIKQLGEGFLSALQTRTSGDEKDRLLSEFAQTDLELTTHATRIVKEREINYWARAAGLVDQNQSSLTRNIREPLRNPFYPGLLSSFDLQFIFLGLTSAWVGAGVPLTHFNKLDEFLVAYWVIPTIGGFAVLAMGGLAETGARLRRFIGSRRVATETFRVEMEILQYLREMNFLGDQVLFKLAQAGIMSPHQMDPKQRNHWLRFLIKNEWNPDLLQLEEIERIEKENLLSHIDRILNLEGMDQDAIIIEFRQLIQLAKGMEVENQRQRLMTYLSRLGHRQSIEAQKIDEIHWSSKEYAKRLPRIQPSIDPFEPMDEGAKILKDALSASLWRLKEKLGHAPLELATTLTEILAPTEAQQGAAFVTLTVKAPDGEPLNFTGQARFDSKQHPASSPGLHSTLKRELDCTEIIQNVIR